MVWLIVMVVCGVIGYAIGEGKGRGGLGAVLGLLLGLIGIIIIAVLEPAPGHGGQAAAPSQRPAMSMPPAEGAAAIEDRLAQLSRLRDSGTLTDGEYAEQRARILQGL